jgi:hypothetical protein
LRHWLRQYDAELIEGIHYSIMFYGGRLLNHLTVLDEPVKDFICLRRLNRHSAVVIDSDRTSRGKNLNGTKTRVRNEFDSDGPGFAWITSGYTIENYVPADVLRAAVSRVDPGLQISWAGEQYISPFGNVVRAQSGVAASVDKIAVAHVVADLWVDRPTERGLLRQIAKMAEFIRAANG